MMKNKILLLLFMAILPLAMRAQKYVIVDDLNYILNTDFTAEVTGSPDCSGDITILPTISWEGITYTVTSIRESAFESCISLTSVTIPNTVTSIGDYAFVECSNLTSITIPNSVTSIGEGAFYYCSGLTSLTFGNSVLSIGEDAFFKCSGLVSISVDADNPNYDSRDDCNALIEKSSNTLILGCKNTVIPNTVTSIKKYAFYNSIGLTSVTIPKSVTSIGQSAFSSCPGIVSISVDADNPNYDSRDDCNALIEKSSNTLILGCKNTVIPNTVTSIGAAAFERCTNLTSVTIPNSVTSIGIDAFLSCTGLTSITIPNSVSNIGKSAFMSCSGLTSVTINNSKVAIGLWAFYQVSAVFDLPDDFEYGGYSSLDEFISKTKISSFQLADKAKVTISPAGVSTFYSFRGLDLSQVEGLQAYVAKEYDPAMSIVTMQEVTEVPAYTGLLLVGVSGTYELPYKSSAVTVEANLLTGTLDATFIPSTEDDMTNFVLYADTDTNPVFRPLANGFNLKANRAYLQLPTTDLPSASSACNVSIEFVETTGIQEQFTIHHSPFTMDNKWYSIEGRQLMGKPTQKGLYIVNGQKVFVK